MAIVVWADVSLWPDDGAAAWATRTSCCDDLGDLACERLRCWQARASGEHRVVVLVLLDIVREDRDALALLIVPDGHFPNDVFGEIGGKRRRAGSGLFGDAGAHEPCQPQLLEQLLDGETEGLELLFFHPERDEIQTDAGDEAETPLARLADRFRLEHSEFWVFVPSAHDRSRLPRGRC